MDANSMHNHGDDTPPRSVEKTETTPPPQEDSTLKDIPTPQPEAPAPEEPQKTEQSAPAEETIVLEQQSTPLTHPEPLQKTEPREEDKEEEKPVPQTSSAGVVVLQWLTYAFWGWLILGLLWLMGVVLANFILHESVSETVPYAIATSVVLLPIAFFTDLFYRKHEPVKKAGGAMVIMVIHTVLYALLGIISLIIAVFIGVNSLINVGEPLDSQMVGLFTALFAALLYAALFLRTLNPFKSRKFSLSYGIAMIVVTVTLLVLAIVGPVVASVASRGDRVIEQGLPSVQAAVETYISDNNKLPASLKDVTINNEDAQKLVDENKVEYIAVGKTESVKVKNSQVNSESYFRYQLCVEYKADSGNSRYSSGYYDGNGSEGYGTYISTYSHGEGRTCYKLQQAAPSDMNVDVKVN